jgi:hypothetical protein
MLNRPLKSWVILVEGGRVSGLISAHHWGSIYQGSLSDTELYGKFRASLSPSIQSEQFSIGIG